MVGPELFASALVAQGVPVRRVDWRPPEGAEALASLWRDEVDAANQVAIERVLAAHQILVDVRPAIEVVPGMTRDTVLHAGPPIAWDQMSGPMRGGIVGALIYEGLVTTWEDAERLVQVVESQTDVVLFTSSSMVTSLVDALGARAQELLGKLTVACIGPVTRETAEHSGLRIDVEAEVFTVEGLLDALETHFAARA